MWQFIDGVSHSDTGSQVVRLALVMTFHYLDTLYILFWQYTNTHNVCTFEFPPVICFELNLASFVVTCVFYCS